MNPTAIEIHSRRSLPRARKRISDAVTAGGFGTYRIRLLSRASRHRRPLLLWIANEAGAHSVESDTHTISFAWSDVATSFRLEAADGGLELSSEAI